MDAAIVAPVKHQPLGKAMLSGVLEPVGIKFRQAVQPNINGQLAIPLPVFTMEQF